MEFTEILKAPNQLDKNKISYLKSIINDFPYLQSARAIYLKALKDNNSFKFHNELKLTAIYSTERNVLFDFITSHEKIESKLTHDSIYKAKKVMKKKNLLLIG